MAPRSSRELHCLWLRETPEALYVGLINGATDIPKYLAELSLEAPGHHSVLAIRELTPDEVDEAERADDLVIKTGNAAVWQRCHRFFEVIMSAIAALQEADPPGPGDIERVRAAFGSLGSALGELTKKLDEAVQEFASPDERSVFAEIFDEVRRCDNWRLVSEIANASAGSFKAAPTGQPVWQRNSDERVLDPAIVALDAIRAAQNLLTHQYLAIGPAITEAAKLLLGLKAEAPGGAPAIVELTMEGDTPTQMTPRSLALDRIAPAMRATRLAAMIAEQQDEAEAQTGLEEKEADNSASEGTAPSTDEPVSSEGAEDEASDPEPDPEEVTPHEPLEFSSLFRLARTLDSDLEKAWSTALDEALVEPAVEKQLAAVVSLVSALQRKLAVQAQELMGAGVDTRIEEWPLSDERLASLVPPAGAEERTKQSGLAQLNAFLEVMETLDGLRKPGNITVSFNQEGESVERFWSAGAFALLKDRVSLLERLTREQDRDVAEAVEQEGKEASGPGSFDAFERLRLGSRAFMHGDPEAAVFHGLMAVAVFLGITTDQIAAKLADPPAEGRSALSEEEKQILSLAADATTRSLAGAPNLPLATLLAEATLRAAHKLTIGPVADSDLSPDELAELIESRQPLQPLEQEDDGGDP